MPLLLVTTLITTLPGISGAPQDNNIMLWNAVILGLDDTLWDLQTIHPTMLISILTFYLFIFHVVYICHLENNSAENFNSLFIFVFFFQMPFFKSFPLNFQSLQSSEKYSGTSVFFNFAFYFLQSLNLVPIYRHLFAELTCKIIVST